MSELMKFKGGVPATADALLGGLESLTSRMTGTGGMPYLRLLKEGLWVYGQEDIEVEEGSLWAINPYSIQHGFACWGDSELMDEVMVPFNEAPPAISTLQDYGYPWKPQLGLQMMCVEGEDKGQTVLYKGTSVGMQNAVKDVTTALVNQLRTDPDNIVPVLELNVDSYRHKKHGKTYVPVLDVVKWVSMDTGEESAGDDGTDAAEEALDAPAEPEQEKAEKPTRRRRGAAKSEPQDDAKSAEPEEKPTRRRRRRNS